jgi:hypothetical protein
MQKWPRNARRPESGIVYPGRPFKHSQYLVKKYLLPRCHVITVTITDFDNALDVKLVIAN